MQTTLGAHPDFPSRVRDGFRSFGRGTTRRGLVLLGIALAVALPHAICLAQTSATGAIAGTILDSSRAVVSDAKVTATNVATGETRTAASSAAGTFLVPLLPPGQYKLVVSKVGFKQAEYIAVPVNVTETRRLDVELQVGALNESVSVQEQAEALQTESSALGHVTTSEQVQSLPLVTRNYTQIIGLSPGVATNVTNAGDLGRGNGGSSDGPFVSHGTTSRDNNFQMNGVEINDIQSSGFFSGGVAIPNPDSIQEFKVQTGQYDAAYGHNAGANVNVVTKTGSNDLHGSVWEFFRNEDLNANDYFRKQNHQPRPILRQNQYGFDLGGPIRKDKLLFFGSYQGTKQTNGVSNSLCASNFFSPPLTNDRSRAALGQLFAGQPTFAKSLGLGGPTVLPDGSNISSQALALMQMKLPNGQYLIPTPQSIDPTAKFAVQGTSTFSDPCKFDENQFMTNGEFLQSSRSKFSARFFWANSTQNETLPPTNLGGPTAPGFPLVVGDQFRNASLTHDFIFSPRLLNQVEIAYHRQVVNAVQQEAFHYSDIGVNAPSFDSQPEIQITGAMTLGGNGQSVGIVQNHYDFEDTLFYTRGQHTFRFGGGIIRSHDDIRNFQYIGGLIFQTFPDFLLGQPAAQNGTPFSNILASVDLVGLFPRQWRAWDGNAFAQDDWKITQRLTLNLGVRYERLGDLSDQLGRNSGFDPSLAVATPPAAGTLAGYVVPSNYTGPMPTGVTRLGNNIGFNGDGQNTWNPRVGFAWQLPHTNRFVLRGGYGIYHTRTTGQPLFQLLATPPFSIIRQLVTTANGGASFANPFPPTATVPFFPPYTPTTKLSITAFAPNFQPPVSQQYSLNLQSQLPGDMVLEVGYVGSRGTHLIRSASVNQAQLASATNPIRGITTNTVANVAQRVPIEGFQASQLTQYQSEGASWYNSVEASLSKRFSHGLQFLASYTFARDLTTNPSTALGANGGVSYGNQFAPHYGPDGFVREQRLVVTYLYNLPSPQDLSSLKGRVLGGWQIAGVSTFQSGQRLSVTYTNSTSVYGIANDFPLVVPGCTSYTTIGRVDRKLGNYINGTCFAKPAVIGADGSGTDFGNAPVGIIHGPDQRNTDIAFIKRTAIRWPNEAANVEFRTEMFNAFNTPQFANPGTAFSTPAFGHISSTAVSPRIVQLALKVNF